MGYAISRGNITRPLYFLLVSSSDHITGATGKTPTVTLLKSAGAGFATPTGAVTEIGNGLYAVGANADDADTVGPLFLHATASGCDPRDDAFEVLQDLSAAAVALSPSSATTTAISASTLIAGALKLIGVLSAGETMAAEDANDGLVRLNELIDSWGTDRLFVQNIVRTVYALTGSQATYTIGPGGDFNQAWPEFLNDAGLVFTVNGEDIELAMCVLSAREYAAITNKDQTGPLPTALYYDRAYSSGLGNVSVWLVPDGTETISVALYTPAVLSQFASLNTTYAFAPGYAKALRYNLALDLLPEYPRHDPAIISHLEKIAGDAKAAVKLPNYQPLLLQGDPALVQGSGRWSLETDSYRGRR
jgi:hypothetical protein